jgi:hypothetical protein
VWREHRLAYPAVTQINSLPRGSAPIIERSGFVFRKTLQFVKSMQASKIIDALAGGVNPCTRQSLQSDSVYGNPQTILALHADARALDFRQNRERKAQRLPENAGRPWSQQEDEQLIDEFCRGISPREMASLHRRTIGVINSRLQKKGFI